MPRSIINQLSNDLQACIETGNKEEARVVIKQANDLVIEKEITLMEAAAIYNDFYFHFGE